MVRSSSSYVLMHFKVDIGATCKNKKLTLGVSFLITSHAKYVG